MVKFILDRTIRKCWIIIKLNNIDGRTVQWCTARHSNSIGVEKVEYSGVVVFDVIRSDAIMPNLMAQVYDGYNSLWGCQQGCINWDELNATICDVRKWRNPSGWLNYPPR